MLSIFLSWATYRIIENPIRFGGRGALKSSLLCASLFTIALIGIYIYNDQGIPSRVASTPLTLNAGDIGHDEFHQYPYEYFYLCTPLKLRTEALRWSDGSIRCFQSKKSEAVQIAIVSDSHAEHLFVGLAEALNTYNIAFYINGGLPFTTNPDFKNIFHHIVRDKNISYVIYTGWWSELFKKESNNHEMTYQDLDKTIKILSAAGKKIYITDDVPKFSFDPKQCKYSRIFSSRSGCSEKNTEFNEQYLIYIKYLNKLVRENKSVTLINTAKYFCDSDSCSMSKDGILMYRDFHHLNLNGSKYLARKILEDNLIFKKYVID